MRRDNSQEILYWYVLSPRFATETTREKKKKTRTCRTIVLEFTAAVVPSIRPVQVQPINLPACVWEGLMRS